MVVSTPTSAVISASSNSSIKSSSTRRRPVKTFDSFWKTLERDFSSPLSKLSFCLPEKMRLKKLMLNES